MSAHIHISLFGTEPVPQGSKTAFVNKATGRAIVTDSNKARLKPWREALAEQASRAMELQGATKIPAGQPVGIEIIFLFARPSAHYGTGKNAGVLKRTAPIYKSSKPDTDKLERAVFDALTGVVFHDDSQVALTETRKLYSEQPGVRVFCYTL